MLSNKLFYSLDLKLFVAGQVAVTLTLRVKICALLITNLCTFITSDLEPLKQGQSVLKRVNTVQNDDRSDRPLYSPHLPGLVK